MAASTKVEKSEKDEIDKMFEDDVAGGGEDQFAGLDDLLDEVEEDDSEGWVPKEKGEGIVGVVVKVGETKSDFATKDEDKMVPVVTIECKDPDKAGQTIKWRVIGYGAVLKRELIDADPQVGDKMGVRYFGEKPIKNGQFKGKMYKHFGVIVKKA